MGFRQAILTTGGFSSSLTRSENRAGDPNAYLDYPELGFDQNAIYLSAFMNETPDSKLCILNKDQLYEGPVAGSWFGAVLRARILHRPHRQPAVAGRGQGSQGKSECRMPNCVRARGLVLVNVSQFQMPILLGQLDLPGEAIEVA